MFEWPEMTGVCLRFIEPGKPVHNALIESFNGRFRDKCFNLHWFRSLAYARDAGITTTGIFQFQPALKAG